MKKPVFLFIAVLLLLFAVITLLKAPSEAPAHSEDTRAAATAEQEEVRQFWTVYRQATAHRIARRLDEALAAYQEALALNDQHEDALYYLGNMHLELGHYAEARAAWERLTVVNDHSARAYAQLGDLAFCHYEEPSFDLDAAEAAYRRALEINSEESGPLLRLGQVALVRGDREEATFFFDAVIGSNYKSVAAYALNGYLAWQQGDDAGATALMTQAVEATQGKAPPAGVLGEGDTKTGTTPIVTGASDCLLFASFIEAVHNPSASPEALYRQLDVLLKQVRS